MSLSVTVTDRSSIAFRVRRVASAIPSPVFVAPVPDGTGRVYRRRTRGPHRHPVAGHGHDRADAVPRPARAVVDQRRTRIAGLRDLARLLELRAVLRVRDRSGRHDRSAPLHGERGQSRHRRSRDDARDPAPAASAHQPQRRLDRLRSRRAICTSRSAMAVAAAIRTTTGRTPIRWLGKILRIDITRDDFPADDTRNYAHPGRQPVPGGGGAPEVWALGLRNPFRASFDFGPFGTGEGGLIIGDVGEEHGRGNRRDARPRRQPGREFRLVGARGIAAVQGPRRSGASVCRRPNICTARARAQAAR